MKKTILLLLLLLSLAGCQYALPPADSGSLETHALVGDRDQVTTTELTSAQVTALGEWFSGHRDGWHYLIADTAPGKMVYLKRSGKSVAAFNLRPEGLYVADLFRTLTQAERGALEAILGKKSG